MVNTKKNTRLEPVGIDKPIAQAQDKIIKSLDWPSLTVYDRVTKVLDGKKEIPQAFVNGEYKKDVLTLELGQSKVFFIDEGNASPIGAGRFRTTIKTVFLLDLSSAYPEIEHRADSEAQRDALEVIRSIPTFKDVEGIETDIKRIFRGYSIAKLKTELLDVHPRYIFAIRSNVKYSLTFNKYTCCKKS